MQPSRVKSKTAWDRMIRVQRSKTIQIFTVSLFFGFCSRCRLLCWIIALTTYQESANPFAMGGGQWQTLSLRSQWTELNLANTEWNLSKTKIIFHHNFIESDVCCYRRSNSTKKWFFLARVMYSVDSFSSLFTSSASKMCSITLLEFHAYNFLNLWKTIHFRRAKRSRNQVICTENSKANNRYDSNPLRSTADRRYLKMNRTEKKTNKSEKAIIFHGVLNRLINLSSEKNACL